MISPHSHIYRLLIILVIGGAGFFWGKGFFVPDSWDSELFYRVDVLEDLKQQPLRFGGNESCAATGCHDKQQPPNHQARLDELARGGHKSLACENCHGPLSSHASNGNKINAAHVQKKGDLCLRCHDQLISRSDEFPQFSVDYIGHWYFEVEKDAVCIECHDPHGPEYMSVTNVQAKGKTGLNDG